MMTSGNFNEPTVSVVSPSVNLNPSPGSVSAIR